MECQKNNLSDWKTYCLEKNIPIIRDLTAQLIVDLIQLNHYQSLLEIGTAYGYSSAYFSSYTNLKQIFTLEYNEQNYLVAKKFLADFKNVVPINTNAFLFEPQQTFDLIFLDGPKSHQETLVEKYSALLNPKGLIVVDNIYLRKIRDLEIKTKDQQHLLKKLDLFVDWAKTNPKFICKILDIDDGVMLISPKGNKND